MMQDRTARLAWQYAVHATSTYGRGSDAAALWQSVSHAPAAAAAAVAAPRRVTCLLERWLADANSGQTPSSACRAAVTPAAAATATAAWAALAWCGTAGMRSQSVPLQQAVSLEHSASLAGQGWELQLLRHEDRQRLPCNMMVSTMKALARRRW